MSKTLVEMAAELVQAQCTTKGMSTDEMTLSLQNAFKALQDLQVEEAKVAQGGVLESGLAAAPSMDPKKSIQKNKIVCLECGEEFKMLSPKHLKSHGLNGSQYREKYGFSKRQPLCAKALSERRQKAGKKRGLPENLKAAIAKRKKGGKKK